MMPQTEAIFGKFDPAHPRTVVRRDFIGDEVYEERELDLEPYDTGLEDFIEYLRNYLDQKVCEDLDLFSYSFDSSDKKWKVTEKDWEYVRDALVLSKSNMGIPSIVVEDGDYKSLGQLYLRHEYDGRELKRKYAEHTLMSIRSLWGRPVFLETIVDGATVILYIENDQVEILG